MGPNPGADPLDDQPPDERPYGTRPYGTRPYGTRPYGTRPYGTRPYGTRPYGTRPYGTRPYGTRPEDPDAGGYDPQEWSRDVGELFAARSALVRLGARLVTGDEYIDLRAAGAREKPAAYGAKPVAEVDPGRLWPRRYELVWSVVLPDDVRSSPSLHPDAAAALKDDIARALALCADREFLAGDGEKGPLGIARRGEQRDFGGNLDARLRAMVKELRDAGQDALEHAGWVLHPSTLDAITELDAESPKPERLVRHDGAGGGLLLGYPFVVSAAALRDDVVRIFFSTDWSEAWIGAYPGVAKIELSSDARFVRDETVVRAVLQHDFALRREEVFVHSAL